MRAPLPVVPRRRSGRDQRFGVVDVPVGVLLLVPLRDRAGDEHRLGCQMALDCTRGGRRPPTQMGAAAFEHLFGGGVARVVSDPHPSVRADFVREAHLGWHRDPGVKFVVQLEHGVQLLDCLLVAAGGVLDLVLIGQGNTDRLDGTKQCTAYQTEQHEP